MSEQKQIEDKKPVAEPVTQGVVSIGELTTGMYVSILEEKVDDEPKFEMPDIFGFGPQPKKTGYATLIGIPFQVEAICLPFVIGHIYRHGSGSGIFATGPSTSVVMLDTRKVILMQVTEHYYNMYVGNK